MASITREPLDVTHIVIRKKDGVAVGYGDAATNPDHPVPQALQLDVSAYRRGMTVEQLLAKQQRQ